MIKRYKGRIIIAVLVLISIVVLLMQKKVAFVLGGAFTNLGYMMQDGLHEYDLVHHEDITPEQVVATFDMQNKMASEIRSRFPRTSHHPLVALVLCMDSRLDSSEVMGDTRKYYYIIRTAGSVIKEKEEEMLELAVTNGVKVILFTTHTNCAAEAVASDPKRKEDFPFLTAAVVDREKYIKDFLSRPKIAKKVADGSLIIKHAIVDTNTKRLTILDK